MPATAPRGRADSAPPKDFWSKIRLSCIVIFSILFPMPFWIDFWSILAPNLPPNTGNQRLVFAAHCLDLNKDHLTVIINGLFGHRLIIANLIKLV